ncbi:MAG: family N-acetyltransferase [Chlamydiales bacterium]|nr:family N-acetyltransferase [Chlamydiales bacterium]
MPGNVIEKGITSMLFNFSPLRMEDLDLLISWLMRSHVMNYWEESLDQIVLRKKYEDKIEDKISPSFIIYQQQNPIGYIQYYWANKVGNGWWPDEVEGTVGIDLFIGEELY